MEEGLTLNKKFDSYLSLILEFVFKAHGKCFIK